MAKTTMGECMELRKLSESFYAQNTHLVEVLDKTNNSWTGGKTRGYGIVVVEVAGLKFGIPLRSNMNHRFGFITVSSEKKGLDYTKAVLLSKDEYISDAEFAIPTAEYIAIKDNTDDIAKEFNKFVNKYVRAAKNNDANVLNYYRYSTLKNYHVELGI